MKSRKLARLSLLTALETGQVGNDMISDRVDPAQKTSGETIFKMVEVTYRPQVCFLKEVVDFATPA